MHSFNSFLTAAAAMLALVAGPSTVAHAQSAGPSLVIDAATGAVLHEERASQAWHPASTTKIMTAYVALRAVRAGRIGLETAIPASPLAAKQPRVKVYIKPGQEITLDAALKVMMVKSANDIAYVIAEGVGGTVPAFVDMMNAEARRLGMRDTAFRNPNGWHDPEQQSSARDLAVLTMTMLREFPDYADYWGIGAVQLGKLTLNNTNGLIGRYAGANGFKTGFVCASGFNVVATATRGGRTLIAVVLGAYSGAERTVKAAEILDAAFGSWGGTGRTVASIAPGGGTAQSICAEVRAFGRGAPLADDADSAGAISFTPTHATGEGVSMYAGVAAPAAAPRPGGRITLGPRAAFTPLQLSYGRSEGSARAPLAANVQRRPGTAVAGAQPAAAPLAPGAPVAASVSGRPRTPSANGSLQPAAPRRSPPSAVEGAAAAFAASGGAAADTSTPIRLPGAIGQRPLSGTSGAAVPLRPSAAAGIRPATAAVAPTAPAAARPVASTARPAGAKPANARPATAKPSSAKPATAKPATSKPAASRVGSAAAKPAASRPASSRPVPPRPPQRASTD